MQLPFISFSDVSSSSLATQCFSGLVTFVSLVTVFDRPRGQLSIDPETLSVLPSNVPGAGLGLFVTRDLPCGTILGTYPGVLRPAHKHMKKYNKIPEIGTYTWRFTDNKEFIDPTDQFGVLGPLCLGGTDDFPLSYFIHQVLLKDVWSVSTMLARINEPPMGVGGCNIMAEENLKLRTVTFTTSRNIYAGEELYMDYGITYDRATYRQGRDEDTDDEPFQ